MIFSPWAPIKRMFHQKKWGKWAKNPQPIWFEQGRLDRPLSSSSAQSIASSGLAGTRPLSEFLSWLGYVSNTPLVSETGGSHKQIKLLRQNRLCHFYNFSQDTRKKGPKFHGQVGFSYSKMKEERWMDPGNRPPSIFAFRSWGYICRTHTEILQEVKNIHRIRFSEL